jgi:hypothetical protein
MLYNTPWVKSFLLDRNTWQKLKLVILRASDEDA